MIAPCDCSDEANLPTKTPGASNGPGFSPSISSELTITPQRLHHHSVPTSPPNGLSPTRLAGIVGIFTGCGALLALGFFLRLPEILQRRGTSPGQSLADSYYIVGTSSLILALLCFLGLRNLHGEDEKGWRNLVYGEPNDPPSKISSLKSLAEAVALGFNNPLIGLSYLGGFVARASVRIFEAIPPSIQRHFHHKARFWGHKAHFTTQGRLEIQICCLQNETLIPRSLVGCNLSLHSPVRERVLYFLRTVR